MKESITSIRNIALIGMMAALMAVISQISIPMPTGVPVTLQIFGLAFIGMMLGWKRGFFAILIYILIGAAGAAGEQVIQGFVHGFSFPFRQYMMN